MEPSATIRRIEELPERFNAAVDLIDHNLVAGRGDKIAVIDHQGGTTYRELAQRIDRMANAFRDLGVPRDHRALLCLVDTVDFPVAFLGAIKAGIIPVPINTLLTPEDFRWLLDNSGADVVLVSEQLSSAWTDIAIDRPDVTFISSGGGPWLQLESLLEHASPMAEAVDSHRDDVAFWLYTSGSTGRPKAAMHAHSSLRLTAVLFGQAVMGYCEDDVVLSVAKQFFAYGLGNALTFPFAVGATVVLHSGRATAEAITALMKAHGVTVLGGVPTFFANWFSQGAPAKAEIPDLRIASSAGEGLPAHLGKAFRAHYGVDIIDGLGSTEMLHVYLSQRPGDVRYGCTGRAVPGYELRLIGVDGAECGPGEIGELQVRGPTSAIGYWRNVPKSRATFEGQWTHTGDQYCRDAAGWFTHCGRGDDMLKVGGIYVSPIEVEEALACHEIVVEAAVVGVPDEAGLIKPRAHVVLSPGVAPSVEVEALLKAHVKSRLAPFKYPRWIWFADELPKTATGKIQRFRLREMS
jgi:benzoate-CoA ligase